MYHGEVNVAQEDLNSFLAVAEDLKVKGLTENNAASRKMKTESSPLPKYTKTVKQESSVEAPKAKALAKDPPGKGVKSGGAKGGKKPGSALSQVEVLDHLL